MLTILCIPLLLAVAGAVVFITLRIVDNVNARAAQTFLGSSPLQQTIAQLCAGASFSAPTYATVARLQDVYDPDDIEWTNSAADMGRMSPMAQSRATWRQESRPAWIPHYFRVNQLVTPLQIGALTASAALPFGIVPSVRFGGLDFVDGGLVDNVPVYPCVEHRVDEVFVILLEPEAEETPSPSSSIGAARWTTMKRLIELSKIREPRPRSGIPEFVNNTPPKILPFRSPPCQPVFKVFAPAKSLGSFMSGTLNFNGTYADELMRQGYRDTLQRLNDLRH